MEGDGAVAGATKTCYLPPCGGGRRAKRGGRGVGGGPANRSIPPSPTLPHRGEGARRASDKAERSLTWLALEPLTGRTHQLRVHCAEMGWPIVGDAIYGTASRQAGPQDGPLLHLHAREVLVPLYKNRAPIRVVAPIPTHMCAALTQCGWRDHEGQQNIAS